MADEGIKRVDEGWKKRAQQEKDGLKKQQPPPPPKKGKAAPEGGAPPRGTPTPFIQFINSLATEALVLLGAVAHPQTGQAVFAPDQAQSVIDMIAMLEEKTKGNLTPDEENVLKNILHELRLAFVEVTRQVEAAPPPSGGS